MRSELTPFGQRKENEWLIGWQKHYAPNFLVTGEHIHRYFPIVSPDREPLSSRLGKAFD
jgi:hypothetical protein